MPQFLNYAKHISPKTSIPTEQQQQQIVLTVEVTTTNSFRSSAQNIHVVTPTFRQIRIRQSKINIWPGTRNMAMFMNCSHKYNTPKLNVKNILRDCGCKVCCCFFLLSFFPSSYFYSLLVGRQLKPQDSKQDKFLRLLMGLKR